LTRLNSQSQLLLRHLKNLLSLIHLRKTKRKEKKRIIDITVIFLKEYLYIYALR